MNSKQEKNNFEELFRYEFGTRFQSIFKPIFETNPDCMSYLFKQYLNTNKQPNLSLYTWQFYTQKEIEQNFFEINLAIKPKEATHSSIPIMADVYPEPDFYRYLREKANDFYLKSTKGQIEEKYYAPEFDKVEIITTTKAIDKLYNSFTDFLSLSDLSNQAVQNKAKTTAQLISEQIQLIDNKHLAFLVFETLLKKCSDQNSVVFIRNEQKGKAELDKILFWEKELKAQFSLALRNINPIYNQMERNDKTWKKYACSYKIDWYLDKDNIPNQDHLIIPMIDYLDNQREIVFTTMNMMNLSYCQQDYILKNYQNTDEAISHLNNIPISERERHTMFGMILKWFGGYPTSNGNRALGKTIRSIEDAFVAFPEATPEKEFCKRDNKEFRNFRIMEIAMTEKMRNPEIDLQKLLLDMGYVFPEKKFQSFDELYQELIQKNIVQNADVDFITKKSIANVNFKFWLVENKGWRHDDEGAYITYLNIDTYKEYLKSITPKHLPIDIGKNNIAVNGESYIKDEILGRLIEIEAKAKGIIEIFSQNKIKCAAWVELLMDKGYFHKEHKNTNRKSCIAFAKERYNVDITTQMATAQNESRNINKIQLEKYFK